MYSLDASMRAPSKNELCIVQRFWVCIGHKASIKLFRLEIPQVQYSLSMEVVAMSSPDKEHQVHSTVRYTLHRRQPPLLL